MPDKKKVIPWVTGANTPVLAVHRLQGQRYGWPLFQLHAWHLEPAGTGDRLRLYLGEAQVIVEGLLLQTIVDDLERGHGGVLCEQGERFASLAQPGELWVSTITVHQPGEI